MVENLIEDFKKLKANYSPNIHRYSSVKDRSLWVLLFAKEKLQIPNLSAYEIQKILTEVFEVSVTIPGVRYALNKTKGQVHRIPSRKG